MQSRVCENGTHDFGYISEYVPTGDSPGCTIKLSKVGWKRTEIFLDGLLVLFSNCDGGSLGDNR